MILDEDSYEDISGRVEKDVQKEIVKNILIYTILMMIVLFGLIMLRS